VVSPANYLKYVTNYLAEHELLGNGLSVGELASVLNSDFKKDRLIARKETKEIVNKGLEDLSATYSLLAENPSAFALDSIYAVEKMPLSSSQYNYFERDIPLLPIALHGKVMYTSTYWNTLPNMQSVKLKAIEYGCGVAYRFAQNIVKENVIDQNSYLYNVDYTLWRNTAVENYQYVSKALEGLQGMKMKEHIYLSDTVARVTYEDGTMIYINYGSEAISIEGVQIEAESYLRKQSLGNLDHLGE